VALVTKPGNILIVDDDNDILTAGRLLLRRHFEAVHTCADPGRIEALMADQDYDAILLDMNFGPGESSGRQGMEWLTRVLEIDPRMVVVMITAHAGVETAVNAMKEGATDFIEKPWLNEKMVATVSAAVELRRSRAEAENLRRTNRVLREAVSAPSHPIVGDSPALRHVLSQVGKAAPTDANVLILGENGTGKELIARELHRLSRRSDEIFLTVDMGTISETLFESELFGHRKGAFTGAGDDRAGRFQAAHGGSLFLDEIGNLPLHLQAKLLSALEQRQVTPLGTDKPQPVDVRVIAATNIDPRVLQDPGQFRQDLLFRLNTVEITVPPLRERRQDILPIARHYLARYARKYGTAERTFSAAAEQALEQAPWPGNVRALRHAVERAVIMSAENMIEPADLNLEPERRQPAPDVTMIPTVFTLDQMEKKAIEEVLRRHGFNISKSARELGLTRASLYRRMEKHNI
jgi:DNA-binding NtrC family response regulator